MHEDRRRNGIDEGDGLIVEATVVWQLEDVGAKRGIVLEELRDDVGSDVAGQQDAAVGRALIFKFIRSPISSLAAII